LIQRLGELTGKPSTSKLHIHPILNSERELGGADPEISTISSKQFKKLYEKSNFQRRVQSSAQWHADISFEPVPADYTSLRLTELPSTGGDTLWASGYEIYDRISAPYQKFLEGLTATFAQPGFKDVATKSGFKLYDKPRGAPENVGDELIATHPVVRTNPGKASQPNMLGLWEPSAYLSHSYRLEINLSRWRPRPAHQRYYQGGERCPLEVVPEAPSGKS
jgi:alpha-ketoglutarate-dependent taurine dioxygenase